MLEVAFASPIASTTLFPWGGGMQGSPSGTTTWQGGTAEAGRRWPRAEPSGHLRSDSFSGQTSARLRLNIFSSSAEAEIRDCQPLPWAGTKGKPWGPRGDYNILLMAIVSLKIDVSGTRGTEAWDRLRQFDQIQSAKFGPEFGSSGPCKHSPSDPHARGEWIGAEIRLQTPLLAQYAVAHYLEQERVLDADVVE